MLIFFCVMLFVILDTNLLQLHFIWAILPIIIAPFYEWYAHKFILHIKLPKIGIPKKMMLELHYNHHTEPKNPQHLFAPWWALILHFLQTYILFTIITWSYSIALVPFTAGILYFLFYEWVHLASHTIEYIPLTTIGKRLKRHHMQHHFYNNNYNWGITNYLADQLLQTKIKQGVTEKNINMNKQGGYGSPLRHRLH